MGCAQSSGTLVAGQSLAYPHQQPVMSSKQMQQMSMVTQQMQQMSMATQQMQQMIPPINTGEQFQPRTVVVPLVTSSVQQAKPTLSESWGEKITIETIQHFQALGVVIANLEHKNSIGKLKAETRRQLEVQKEIDELTEQYRILEAKTSKEFQDVSNLKAIADGQSVSKFFASQQDFDQQFSKEEKEYLQAKTEQENCNARLDKLKDENTKISRELDNLKKDNAELMIQYEKQDKILEEVFGGTYGSTLEDQLEEKLDKMEDHQRKVTMAMDRWKNCEALIAAASKQLDIACKRWFDLQRIPTTANNQVLRIQVISESRNFLISSLRNITNAQRYLYPVKFPYCDASEMSTLTKAITFIYIDGMSRERHNHAMQVYQTTHVRSIMLLKWVKNVIEQRISVDLSRVRQEFNECRQSLRSERLRLMKKKVEEQTGETLDISASPINDDFVESDFEEGLNLSDVAQAEKVEDAQNLDEKIAQVEADNVEGLEAAVVMAAANSEEADKTPLDQLAPAPTRNELFGDLDTIMVAYDQQKQILQEEQESARARQEANIKAKMRKRRSRQMRLQAQETI